VVTRREVSSVQNGKAARTGRLPEERWRRWESNPRKIPPVDLLTVAIPGVGDRALSHRQVYDLYRACAGALEASLPVEGKGWRDNPARARTSGVKATADLAKNKRKKAA
jgi:hypothetical protein